ncbi:hypothetical protein ACJRO7_004606 [Eucalyptus globulus]|uniref:G-patch domain-containing protein n=1 Tax=Eucalyptus globulus TaxID=34317 RepID=A0ABD3IZE6_EUCGL
MSSPPSSIQSSPLSLSFSLSFLPFFLLTSLPCPPTFFLFRPLSLSLSLSLSLLFPPLSAKPPPPPPPPFLLLLLPSSRRLLLHPPPHRRPMPYSPPPLGHRTPTTHCSSDEPSRRTAAVPKPPSPPLAVARSAVRAVATPNRHHLRSNRALPPLAVARDTAALPSLCLEAHDVATLPSPCPEAPDPQRPRSSRLNAASQRINSQANRSNYQTPASALYEATDGSRVASDRNGESGSTASADPVAMMEFYMKKAAQEERRRQPRQSKDEMPPPPSLQGPAKKGHHMGDFIPPEELERFLASCNDASAQRIQADNVSHKLLSKMGWKCEGLGSSRSGIADPIMAGEVKKKNLGVGAHNPREVAPEDDIYEQLWSLSKHVSSIMCSNYWIVQVVPRKKKKTLPCAI